MCQDQCMICMERLVPKKIPICNTQTKRFCLPQKYHRTIAACCQVTNTKPHVFHRSCLKQWYYNVSIPASSGCPICRRPLFANHAGAKLLRLDKLAKYQDLSDDSASEYGSETEADEDDGVEDTCLAVIDGDDSLYPENNMDSDSDSDTPTCQQCRQTISLMDHQVTDCLNGNFHTRCWIDLHETEFNNVSERLPELTADDVVLEMMLEEALHLHSNGIDITDEFIQLVYQEYIEPDDSSQDYNPTRELVVAYQNNRYLLTRHSINRFNRNIRLTTTLTQTGLR